VRAPPRNHVALAEVIDILVNDNKMRRVLGENAYVFVQENLSVEKIANQIRQLLSQSLRACEESGIYVRA
jgi:glycosyltransferase involved in cell wall biosynthesis